MLDWLHCCLLAAKWLRNVTTTSQVTITQDPCTVTRCIITGRHFWQTVSYNSFFFKIQFWYLRCCGCPWNRGRQHLATPLKTCHNTEAGFFTGWLLCLSPNSELTASETPPFPHLGCVPAVVPAKGGSSAYPRWQLCQNIKPVCLR